jgi:hypothetical protein
VVSKTFDFWQKYFPTRDFEMLRYGRPSSDEKIRRLAGSGKTRGTFSSTSENHPTDAK